MPFASSMGSSRRLPYENDRGESPPGGDAPRDRLFHTRFVDLLLTDVAMPKMTGAELARRLRLNDPDLKVLYLTGCSDQLFEEKATLWHQEAFLEKPCTAAGLLQAVSLAVTGKMT
ncbi:MAG: hypothetical protein DMD48_15505 [Gemmatimonadetes bacterium]|nr:MAG: hypothetical protein DMD48_15505 [Gemmatimonadota bacterium]